MELSEMEYLVISEMVRMEDRELAQQIELAIWPDGPKPKQAVLNKFIDAMKATEDNALQFTKRAKDIIRDLIRRGSHSTPIL